jgi:hypothetical protein
MTQDELLTRITIVGDTSIEQALRAVVELCNFLDKKGHCCVPVKEVIQAIEKELG